MVTIKIKKRVKRMVGSQTSQARNQLMAERNRKATKMSRISNNQLNQKVTEGLSDAARRISCLTRGSSRR